MVDIADAPSSCRSCAFLVKCFGQPDEGPLVRPPVIRDLWTTTPIVADGIASRMIAAGRTGPVVIFVHGEGGSAERWAYNLNAIARAGYRAVAIDLPGHGFASKSEAFEPSIAAYSRFLLDIIARFDEPVTLVGAGIGAHIAALATAARPAAINGLVFAGSTALPVGSDRIDKLQRQIIYRTREGALERFRRAFWDTRIAGPELVEHEFRLNTSPGAAEAQRTLALYIGQSLDAQSDAAALRRIAADRPVEIVWGADDSLTPLALAEAAIAELGGRARLSVMKKTGHLPNFERPGEFNSLLLDALRRPAAAADPQLFELELAR